MAGVHNFTYAYLPDALELIFPSPDTLDGFRRVVEAGAAWQLTANYEMGCLPGI